jgi:16S rRNA (cytosine1402-N4)-methyltransferase
MLVHDTVLLHEAVDLLDVKKDGIYVDCTLGGGGHTKEILSRLEGGRLFAFDRDGEAILRLNDTIGSNPRLDMIRSDFRNIKTELARFGITKVDGILMDLGLSSFQIDDPGRGFSYMHDVSLDMRMDKDSALTAKEVVNTWDEGRLKHIFRVYGEEKNASRIASMIVRERPHETTYDLVRITDRINRNVAGHSAKRVFQAIRIAVNDELTALEHALSDGLDLLNPEGRMSIITFHSLEDRIVKHFFKAHSETHVPKGLPLIDLPVPDMRLITRKPVLPSQTEQDKNPRSRSAKLRVAQKNIRA